LPSPCVSIADFNALHSRRHEEELQLYAFDVLALDGEDLRGLPLSMRKTNLARLLRGRSDGIFVAPFEQGEIGPDLFRAACKKGLEGMVSKRADRSYRAGRCTHWVKMLWGGRREHGTPHFRFDASRSLTALKQDNTIIAVIEMSQSKRGARFGRRAPTP
jgi:hypothetical protein